MYLEVASNWSIIKMNSMRSLGILKIKNKILVRVDEKLLNFFQLTLFLVEKYCPVKKKWEFIESIKMARSNFTAAVINDQIYVIAGFDGKVI